MFGYNLVLSSWCCFSSHRHLVWRTFSFPLFISGIGIAFCIEILPIKQSSLIRCKQRKLNPTPWKVCLCIAVLLPRDCVVMFFPLTCTKRCARPGARTTVTSNLHSRLYLRQLARLSQSKLITGHPFSTEASTVTSSHVLISSQP